MSIRHKYARRHCVLRCRHPAALHVGAERVPHECVLVRRRETRRSLAESDVVLAVALALVSLATGTAIVNTAAQVPPSSVEAAHYIGLHAAALRGDIRDLRRLIEAGAAV